MFYLLLTRLTPRIDPCAPYNTHEQYAICTTRRILCKTCNTSSVRCHPPPNRHINQCYPTSTRQFSGNNTRVLAGIWPLVLGYWYFTLETPWMTTYRPLHHAPWAAHGVRIGHVRIWGHVDGAFETLAFALRGGRPLAATIRYCQVLRTAAGQLVRTSKQVRVILRCVACV